MKKTSNNHLTTFEKIYYTESIKEKNEDRISWRSEYLKSLKQVVSCKEIKSESLITRSKIKLLNLNLFNQNSSKLKNMPVVNFLISLLKKEPQ